MSNLQEVSEAVLKLANAVEKVVNTPHIVIYLIDKDPMVLVQLQEAATAARKVFKGENNDT